MIPALVESIIQEDNFLDRASGLRTASRRFCMARSLLSLTAVSGAQSQLVGIGRRLPSARMCRFPIYVTLTRKVASAV